MQWLAEICVHRPVFATVIVLFMTVVGGFSFFTLGVDRFPKIDLPTISVSTSNPGAAPAEMETEVTDPIEGALNTVPGIDEMRSSSSRGGSNITLTFNLEKDPDQAFQEVQQKLSTVQNRLPEDADPPVARKSDPDSQPVLMYAISSDRNVTELSDLVTTANLPLGRARKPMPHVASAAIVADEASDAAKKRAGNTSTAAVP